MTSLSARDSSYLGLNTYAALTKLCDVLSTEIDIERSRIGLDQPWTCARLGREMVHAMRHSANNCPWTFCWVYLFCLLTSALALMLGTFSEHATWGQFICAIILLFFVAINFWLAWTLRRRRRNEMVRKAQKLLKDLLKTRDSVRDLECSDLYEPSSECIHLQWTYRDQKLVNIPWMLLVPGDRVHLRPGREAPCACKELIAPDSNSIPQSFSVGQKYVTKDIKCIETDCVLPIDPLPCEVLEAPLARHLRASFKDGGRPPTFLDNEVNRTIHNLNEKIGLPLLISLSVIVALIRSLQWPKLAGNALDMFLTFPALVALPLIGPAFPLYYWLVNYWNMAVALCLNDDLTSGESNVPLGDKEDEESVTVRLRKPSGNVFADEGMSGRNKKRISLTSNKIHFSTVFKNLLCGDPSSLPCSANLVHTLGNLTSVSVVDKKGILSWPNPTPEKIFLFKEAPKTETVTSRSDNCVIRTSSYASNPFPSGPGMAVEVLNLTHEPDRAFAVHFDDPNWSQYLPNLKPIGENIRLNSCEFDPNYNRFLDHVTAVSESVPRTIAIANRRCCCYLANTLGFAPRPLSEMYCNVPYGKPPTKTLGVYKRQPGEPPVPGLTKHRTPLANFFASLSTDPKSFHYHLMAQGTADLMLDVCSHVWTGQSLREMSRSARRKVADFYQRNSMTSYCLAFSYRATGAQLAPEMINKYVEWPLDRRAGAALHQVDARRPISMSVDSLLSDEFVHVDKVENAADCLDAALSDHTFLGMITLQYQAKPEVVRLVENLDKACIRFVYFSKENELRSRIFAEKIGLEAGWNCHISLANEGGADNLRKKDSGHSRKDTSSSSKYSTSLQNRTDAFNVGPLSSLTGERVAAPVGVHHRRSLPRHALVDLPTVRFDCVPSSAPVSPAHSDIEMGLTVDVDDSDETSPPSVPAGVDTSNDSSMFDFETGYSRHRLSVPAMSPNLGNMLRRADEARDRPADGTKAPLLSESASAASITSSDRDIGVVPGPMPNYARLPTGIDNIRPHLEQVDNVPLLVSLFTDCDHTTNKEMIHIMQDYGEVVLAVGSSLDYYNGDTFCQANVAFAVEPSHPSTCVRKPITPPSPSKSAGAIAGQLMALPCSLWVSGGRELNLLGLIAICRHRVAMTRSGLIFLLMACAAISCAHLFSVLAFLPPLLEPVQILIWLCVSLPLLSASLLGAPFNQGESLRLTTPKNHNHVGRKVTIRTALGFAVKFLPTVFAVVLLFGFTLIEFCAKIDGADCLFHANENSSALAKGSWAVWGDEYAEGLLVARQLSAFAFTIYLCAISFGFVAYREQFWRKNPLRNVAWVGACILIVAFQIIYAAVDLYFNTHTKEFLFRLSDINWWLFIAAALWLPIVCTLNELYKAREIQLYRRDQRRGKLSFNTKLGMNSPY